jgi:hypothetical protein
MHGTPIFMLQHAGALQVASAPAYTCSCKSDPNMTHNRLHVRPMTGHVLVSADTLPQFALWVYAVTAGGVPRLLLAGMTQRMASPASFALYGGGPLVRYLHFGSVRTCQHSAILCGCFGIAWQSGILTLLRFQFCLAAVQVRVDCITVRPALW